jgi:hypothetical protein
MPFASGSVLVPTLAPGEPAEVTVELDRQMHGRFDISLLKNAPLLSAGAEVTEVSHTDKSVTLRVIVKDGLVGAGAIFVICMPQTGPPETTTPPGKSEKA